MACNNCCGSGYLLAVVAFEDDLLHRDITIKFHDEISADILERQEGIRSAIGDSNHCVCSNSKSTFGISLC